MDASLRAQILNLLNEHRIMTLATNRADGWPQATTVGYVNDGLNLYFMCGRDSQKARNLALDDRVSLTIDHDTNDPMAIRGLSMAARAIPVSDQAELRRSMMKMVPVKFPEYVSMMKQEDLARMAAFKLIPKFVSVLDYSKGFGHSELIAIEPKDLT